jgi:hypothetical protein
VRSTAFHRYSICSYSTDYEIKTISKGQTPRTQRALTLLVRLCLSSYRTLFRKYIHTSQSFCKSRFKILPVFLSCVSGTIPCVYGEVCTSDAMSPIQMLGLLDKRILSRNSMPTSATSTISASKKYVCSSLNISV